MVVAKDIDGDSLFLRPDVRKQSLDTLATDTALSPVSLNKELPEIEMIFFRVKCISQDAF